MTVRVVELAESLQKAREGLVYAREEEKLHLRRNLHDGITPTLTGSRFLAASIQRDAGIPSPNTLKELVEGLGTAIEAVSRVVDDLRPPELDAGLDAAIRALAGDFSHGKTAIQVDPCVDLLLPRPSRSLYIAWRPRR